MAADRTRSARAELSAAAHDLFLPSDQRLTDQQRALIGDLLAKLVGAVELLLLHQVADRLPGTPDLSDTAWPTLEVGGLLRDSALLRLVMQRAEEHRLSLVAADAAFDAAGGIGLLDALARSADAELARRAVAYVVGEARRRDRFREPLLLADDLPPTLAYRLYWLVAAALRAPLRQGGVDAAEVDRALEDAVREAMADHSESQGSRARALRLAARLEALGELSDDFLLKALEQGHLALFACGLSVRAGVALDLVWQLLADRGRHSLLAMLRGIGAPAASAAAIVELLEAGQPIARSPAAQRALLAAYEAIEPSAARRLLAGWRLDPGFREAIDDLNAETPR
ncbi:DUF2336 domain-containing protein [Sphingoaurantiacus capsulatus]|uniref:DUF2336 domain-containing protein n=1 Tax=Sphingoaurantiacus capsulatus TaxID=1771310 RepID=A0ABV7XEL1_9SPHN